jgi:hypothetical protein
MKFSNSPNCCHSKKGSFKMTITQTLMVGGMKIIPLLLPPPLQIGIIVTASLCITAAHCCQSTNISNSLHIKKFIVT